MDMAVSIHYLRFTCRRTPEESKRHGKREKIIEYVELGPHQDGVFD